MTAERRIAFLFPGQGSQAVGMGRDLLDAVPGLEPLLAEASRAAGENVRKLCLRGPLPALSRTHVLQPAITAINLACLEYLQVHGVRPVATAGHSLGEYSALVASGVVAPADAVRLTARRGRLMEDTAQERPGAMIAVVGLPGDEVRALVEELLPRERGGVANLNAPTQVVVSGETTAIDEVTAALKARRARVVKLNVSGAWHSELMAPIEVPFSALLDKLYFAAPSIELYMNVTGKPTGNAEEIRDNLRRQLRNPVRWVDIIEGLAAGGITHYVEVGPGKVLRGLLRRILPDARSYEVHTTGDLRSLQRVVEMLA